MRKNSTPYKNSSIDFSKLYIWRTRGDERVRVQHAEREGRIYEWDKPPLGGHPGDEINCRCWAESLAHDKPIPKNLWMIPWNWPYRKAFDQILKEDHDNMMEAKNKADLAQQKVEKEAAKLVTGKRKNPERFEEALKERDKAEKLADKTQKKFERSVTKKLEDDESPPDGNIILHSDSILSLDKKPAGISDAELRKRMVDEIHEVPPGWKGSLMMFKDFLLGTGPERYVFTEGSPQVEDMKTSYGVERVRKKYIEKYVDLLMNNDNVDLSGTSYTNAGYNFLLHGGPIRSGTNPTQQFIGSFDIEIFGLPNRTIRVKLSNKTSYESFLYHLPFTGEWTRAVMRPMGNVYQEFIWEEKIGPYPNPSVHIGGSKTPNRFKMGKN